MKLVMEEKRRECARQQERGEGRGMTEQQPETTQPFSSAQP